MRLNDSRKRKIADSPADIKDADSAMDNTKCSNKNHPLQTDETDHPKVWPHGFISILQHVIPQKEIERATPSLVGPHANLIPQKEIERATPSLVGPQADLIPQRGIKRATPSSFGPQADLFLQREIKQATPSSVWIHANLISTLQNKMATTCPHPLKPPFEFDLSVEAAEKNFISLTRKFGGDLHLTLHAQDGLPLSYGSEFKPALTLKSIFRK
jgi:hypothetical protein